MGCNAHVDRLWTKGNRFSVGAPPPAHARTRRQVPGSQPALWTWLWTLVRVIPSRQRGATQGCSRTPWPIDQTLATCRRGRECARSEADGDPHIPHLRADSHPGAHSLSGLKLGSMTGAARAGPSAFVFSMVVARSNWSLHPVGAAMSTFPSPISQIRSTLLAKPRF